MLCVICSKQIDQIKQREVAEEFSASVDNGRVGSWTFEEEAIYHGLCCEDCTGKYILTIQ